MQNVKFAAAKLMVQRAFAAAAGASALLLAGAAQAALVNRDLDGDTFVDAFYDTDLNITWLRNADVNGLQNWNDANDWANAYSFGGFDDWRLPTGATGTCTGYNCTDNEMGHLWYVELGNVAGAITNFGGFQNLQSYYYWSGTQFAPDPIYAWYFNPGDGQQQIRGLEYRFHAMAVRSGDVATTTVPEPSTVVLLLAGFAALARARSQRPR